MAGILLLIVIYLSFIGLGLPDSLLGSAWPLLYKSLNTPVYYAGYISMIIAGGTVISSIFSEKIIRCFGTGIVVIISVLMTAAALVEFSFAHSFIILCFCAVPLGLGAGSIDAALNNYVALHYKAKHMNWLHCFWGVGVSIGTVIMASFLIRMNSWNWGYRTVGIIQLILAAVLFITLPLWEKNKLQNVSEQEKQQAIKLTGLFGIPGLKQMLITFFCYCAIETVTGLWGSTYLVIEKHIPPEIAAQWIALYYAGITFGRFVSGFLTVKLNNRQMVRLGQGFIAAGIVVLLLPFEATILLFAFFIIGLGCAPIYPSLLHETPENFGKTRSQAIMGIQMASAYTGTTLMPPLFGKIASYTGFNIFPLFIGIILIIKIIMTELINRKHS